MNKQQLAAKIWESANKMRSKIEANEYIAPLMAALHRTPDGIIADLVAKVRALADKYAVTYAEVAEQIATTKLSLSAMIDRLTGSEYDMQGLDEFQSCLGKNR